MSGRKLEDVKGLPKQFRAGTIEVRQAEGEEQATYEVAVSSETPIGRWFGTEILSHERSAVDLARFKRGAPVLVEHRGEPIGVIESSRIDDDKVLRAVIRFSRSAKGQEVEQDVKDRIRTNVSVGYFISKAKRIDDGEGQPVYRVTRWQPAEVSIVGVPADITVGVGRSEDGGEEFPVDIETDGGAVKEERGMLINKPVLNDGPAGGGAAAAAVTVEATAEEKRGTEIRALCETHGLQARALDYVASTLSVAEIAGRIAEAKKTPGPAMPGEGLTGRDARAWSKFSYHKLLRQAVSESEGDGRVDGIERSVHEELLKSYPAEFKRHGGYLVPMRTRTLTSVDSGKGVETVPSAVGDLIEVLRKRARVLSAGATLLTGLSGPVGFPKQTTGATVQWVGENPPQDVADSDPAFVMANLVPKTMQGNIAFTRQFLMQSSLDVEGVVRNELGIGHGLAIDYAALHGLGAAGEPTGLYSASGVNSHNFSSSWANFTVANLSEKMVGAIADANADVDGMRWLATPLVAAKARATLEFSAAGSATLWQGPFANGSMLGYGAATTAQLSKTMTGAARIGGAAHGLVFGNWPDYYVALFGMMELVVDPYSRKKRAIIEVTSFQQGDTLARHGESFAVALNLTLT